MTRSIDIRVRTTPRYLHKVEISKFRPEQEIMSAGVLAVEGGTIMALTLIMLICSPPSSSQFFSAVTNSDSFCSTAGGLSTEADPDFCKGGADT